MFESNRSKLYAAMTHCESISGVHPMRVYCQFTGKAIATIDCEEELLPIAAEYSDDSIEELADDLLLRTLASMRPSPAWNKMRAESLNEMMERNKVDTLAYLLNRLFASRDSLKQPFGYRLDEFHSRVRLHASLARAASEDYNFDSLLYMLIELDAKVNLSQQVAPFAVHNFFVLTPDTWNTILRDVIDWHHKLIAKYNKSIKDELDSAKWFKGNSLAKPAFFNAWMQAKPETETSRKRKEKRKSEEFMLNLLSDIVGSADSLNEPAQSERTKVVVKPVVKTSLPAFLRKKDS